MRAVGIVVNRIMEVNHGSLDGFVIVGAKKICRNAAMSLRR
jgi:hypothetical protein